MRTTYEQNFTDERISYNDIVAWARKKGFEISNFVSLSSSEPRCYSLKIDKDSFCFYNLSDFESPNIKVMGVYTSVYERNSSFIEQVAQKLDKSILELCYEIKPITVERLNKITIEQWEKWAEKNDLYITTLQLPDVKNEAHLLCKKHGGFVLIEYIISDDHQDRTFIDLLSLINITFDKHDLCNMNKAIHDLVWELETI